MKKSTFMSLDAQRQAREEEVTHSRKVAVLRKRSLAPRGIRSKVELVNMPRYPRIVFGEEGGIPHGKGPRRKRRKRRKKKQKAEVDEDGEEVLTLQHLPTEVLLEIILRLSTYDIVCSAALVSKEWFSLVHDSEYVWRMLLKRDFGQASSYDLFASLEDVEREDDADAADDEIPCHATCCWPYTHYLTIGAPRDRSDSRTSLSLLDTTVLTREGKYCADVLNPAVLRLFARRKIVKDKAYIGSFGVFLDNYDGHATLSKEERYRRSKFSSSPLEWWEDEEDLQSPAQAGPYRFYERLVSLFASWPHMLARILENRPHSKDGGYYSYQRVEKHEFLKDVTNRIAGFPVRPSRYRLLQKFFAILDDVPHFGRYGRTSETLLMSMFPNCGSVKIYRCPLLVDRIMRNWLRRATHFDEKSQTEKINLVGYVKNFKHLANLLRTLDRGFTNPWPTWRKIECLRETVEKFYVHFLTDSEEIVEVFKSCEASWFWWTPVEFREGRVEKLLFQSDEFLKKFISGSFFSFVKNLKHRKDDFLRVLLPDDVYLAEQIRTSTDLVNSLVKLYPESEDEIFSAVLRSATARHEYGKKLKSGTSFGWIVEKFNEKPFLRDGFLGLFQEVFHEFCPSLWSTIEFVEKKVTDRVGFTEALVVAEMEPTTERALFQSLDACLLFCRVNTECTIVFAEHLVKEKLLQAYYPSPEAVLATVDHVPKFFNDVLFVLLSNKTRYSSAEFRRLVPGIGTLEMLLDFIEGPVASLLLKHSKMWARSVEKMRVEAATKQLEMIVREHEKMLRELEKQRLAEEAKAAELEKQRLAEEKRKKEEAEGGEVEEEEGEVVRIVKSEVPGKIVSDGDGEAVDEGEGEEEGGEDGGVEEGEGEGEGQDEEEEEEADA